MAGSNQRPSWITTSFARYLIAALLLIFSSIYYSIEIGIIHTGIFLIIDFIFSYLASRGNDNRISFLGRIFAVLLALSLPTLLFMGFAIFNSTACGAAMDCPKTIEKRRATP